MGDAWMPGAVRLPAQTDGGQLRGGAPRAVWLTLDTDPRLVSARSAALHARELGRAPHVAWNPVTGETVQLISILRAGCALGGAGDPAPHPRSPYRAGAAVNTEGRLCVQIGVVGFASDPFTAYPMSDLELIIWWLDSWHIPRSWPAGPPVPFSHAHAGPRSRRQWARGGHFGASQVPECPATGPGAIEVGRITDPVSIPSIGLPRTPPAALRGQRTAPRAALPVRFGAVRQPGATGAQLTRTR